MTVKYRMRRVPIDDTPQDAKTSRGVSSNWAYDHAALYTALKALYDTHILNFGLHTKVVHKTADQTVHDSTTLVNDSELLFAMAANEKWLIKGFIRTDATAAADLDMTFIMPSGATGVWGFAAAVSTAFGSETYVSGSDTINVCAAIIAIVTCSTTPGNCQFQWAQRSQVNEDTKVLAGSCLIATKIA